MAGGVDPTYSSYSRMNAATISASNVDPYPMNPNVFAKGPY